MRKAVKKITYSIAVLIAVMLFFFSSFVGGGVGSAYAASSSSVSAFDTTYVLDDLETATIDGKKFSVVNYPYDSTGIFKHPEIFTVVEYCYSIRSAQRNNYALYVYFYNPQALNISTTSKANKITLGVKYGEDKDGNITVDGYEKFDLQFCSKSVGDYNNLFYKFKVIDHTSAIDGKTIAERVNSVKRRYDISEIELLTAGDTNATAYGVGGTYSFTGYAKGYGSDTEAESTLACERTDFETLQLDVHSTYYRPNGSNGSSNRQDTLHSVYFSVPNEIVEKYEELTAIHATWLNASTNPIYVTGNKTFYDNFIDLVGKVNQSTDYAFHTNSKGTFLGGFYFSNYSHGYNYADVENEISRLDYVFYADNNDADNYILPAETIANWFKTYTKKFGGELVNGKYSRNLFANVDSSFSDLVIHNTDTFKLTSKTTTTNLWSAFFGTSGSFTNNYEVSAIEPITFADIEKSLSSTTFCAQHFIAESDYDEFYNFVKSATENNETSFLFRYYQSEYFSVELSEGVWKDGLHSETVGGLTHLVYGTYYDQIDTNSYLCQMEVQLDFDIIDITFSKEGAEFVFPVVSSPKDLISDATPPLNTERDPIDWRKVISLILGLIIVVVIIVLLAPFVGPIISLVVNGVLWVICLPFKLIAKLFNKKE